MGTYGPGDHAEPELHPSPASLWNGIYVPQAARLSLGIRHLLPLSGQKDESGYCRRLPKGAASLTAQHQAQDSPGETAVRKDAKRPGRKSQELPRCTKANRIFRNDMVTLQTYYGKKKKKGGGQLRKGKVVHQEENTLQGKGGNSSQLCRSEFSIRIQR